MGGGAMRAAAKLTGVSVATGGIRCITAEHLPVSASKRGPFNVRAAATTISSGEEMKLVSSQSQNSCSEIDDWVYTGGEEKVSMGDGEPMPRVVFGGAPTLQEAKEATSELAATIEKTYLSSCDTAGYGSSIAAKHDLGSSLSNSQINCAKACGISEIIAPAITSPAVKAFRLLHESSAAQNVVASIACDPNVWTAVLQNPELQEFLHSQTSLGVSDPVSGADHPEKLSAKSIEDSSSDTESGPANGFADFVQKMKVTLTDMMNSLSDFFGNLFGGKGAKVFANGDGTPRLSAENAMEASFLGLAVMAIVVILFKRA
ncbi:hypothetical protein F511_04690 [Dorcoceras hygrometricum]|uniref:Uncharacterized protein n=1 Tax=Dorcoceras hygrometricum TaxID=472368 RepID=A0A2Z7B6N9_9LAMI|nr:hypothetical protein F511_04690 [Dorcoceras hygrometricum]